MDSTTSAYRLLEMIALSGECNPNIFNRLGISPSYSEKLITRLKDDKYIKAHYKEHLRGYRLTNRGKKLLLEKNPRRFFFYLHGNSETNRPRSELPRRLRLHQAAITYTLLLNSGVTYFRDLKPPLFQAENQETFSLPLPVYYHSREIKELGMETVKINNSRLMGVLLSSKCIYAVFYTGDNLMKWEYRTELKVKALLSYHTSRGILSHGHINPWYHPDTPIKALMIGCNQETSLKLMTSTGGFQKSYFYLDSSFDYFHFIPDSAAGEIMLQLLCSPALQLKLKEVLLSDLQPPCSEYGLEHDAISDGLPVLVAFDFDMLRIARFRTSLSLHEISGILLCFDFQKDSLEQFFKGTVTIKTIDLKKFKRRFLN